MESSPARELEDFLADRGAEFLDAMVVALEIFAEKDKQDTAGGRWFVGAPQPAVETAIV